MIFFPPENRNILILRENPIQQQLLQLNMQTEGGLGFFIWPSFPQKYKTAGKSQRSEKCRGRYCTLLYLVKTKSISGLALLLLGKAEHSDP